MRAKKSLGQHFLRSERALNTIVETGNIKPQDKILEIGPGEGVLTRRLLAKGALVTAIEKDDFLFKTLLQKFEAEIKSKQLTLIHGDALELEIPNTDKLISNIPYNITGAVFKKFLESQVGLKMIVLLVQKEVAERIVAKDGKESILSISVKAYGKPKYIETVKAGSFVPSPKVDSAIISIDNISKEFFTGIDEKKFFQMLKAGFKSKRKKLSSNLKGMFDKEKVQNSFLKAGLPENIRAEDINIDTWHKISEQIL